MTHRDEVRDFLISRRARVTPAMVGLPDAGVRRVPGLRRGEVAVIAGVSVEYYTKIERGDLRGVSDEVLDAVATALRFTEAERSHLFDLARSANAGVRARRRPATQPGIRASLRHLVDSLTDGAAVVANPRGDVVATNDLARALYDPLYATQAEPVSYPRFIFLDPASRTFYPDWAMIADASVASLRTAAGRNPFDRSITDLVGELSTRSQEFRTRWARHDVRLHIEGLKRLHHPVVGELELEYNVLALPADDGLDLTVYTAPPGSASGEKLTLLATWWASTRTLTQSAPPQD
ncbi:MAG: helix-turn-helix transcriptional regulator [Actinomycetes bacterium]|nr:helix-turn-helix transcriptional regulator [Actinomycetes bacterium]MDX5381193.1 helix-turn-helix transcriptional regulator [Actinomycetes bacterium]MDX5400485.1 helix-turn-helix transcriptional regulator [Actinomycetes bacterium]MDX5450960.1 helix-turn-helix transcriptional regulator [Actinomycetes bacterium]